MIFVWIILIGSNLKFKLTEFGTLEIISTVETDKGEYEWSTPTQHRKTSSDDRENNKKGKKSKGDGKETFFPLLEKFSYFNFSLPSDSIKKSANERKKPIDSNQNPGEPDTKFYEAKRTCNYLKGFKFKHIFNLLRRAKLKTNQVNYC